MSTQENYLKGIADAIRAKTGESGSIQASQFATKISGIQTTLMILMKVSSINTTFQKI